MDVSLEILYKNILNLHYIRNSTYNHQDLEKSADYIENKFREYGLTIESQIFNIEESDLKFKNVIATFNPGKEKEFIIVSHYDHIIDSVGADDNLSGVSIMLEVARIISKISINFTVKFISFTLEEEHAGYMNRIYEKLAQLGLINEEKIANSYNNKKYFTFINDKLNESLNKGDSLLQGYEKIIENHRTEFDEKKLEYLLFRIESTKKQEMVESENPRYLVGSTNYISRSKANLKKIIGVINLETCGYTSKAKNSQKFPTGMNPEYFPQNDVKDATIGDYIVIVVDKNSEKLRQIFFEQTKEKIPSLLIGMPMNYEEIKKTARDLLRSDHAPFWKMNVPALMITDTANFRNPYYHTPGDTIGTLDFEFMAKLTEVVVNTIKVYKD